MQLKKIDSELKVNLESLKVVAANFPVTPCGQQTSLDLTFMKTYGRMKGCTHTWSSVWTVLACESCSGKPTAQEPCCQSLRLWQSAQGQQRICSQRRLVGCKGEQTLALLQETSKWVQSQVNTQSRQRGPLVQAIKGPLNPQSYPTFVSYLQVREPKSITSRLRAAHISDPGWWFLQLFENP